jgi:hypothetical protein
MGYFAYIMMSIDLILIGTGLYLRLRPGGILRKEQVLESWGMLIENGLGKYNEVFQDTENFILVYFHIQRLIFYLSINKRKI